MRPPPNGSHLPAVEPGHLVPGQALLGYMPPPAALAGWPEFRRFLAPALAWSDGVETEASLFAKIMHGQNLLFAVLRVPTVILATVTGEQPQPRHVGVIVVELSLDGAVANIVALAFDQPDGGMFPGAIAFLRQLLSPVTWLECYSRREGMERFLTGHGWRRRPFRDLRHGGNREPEGFKRFVLGPPEAGEVALSAAPCIGSGMLSPLETRGDQVLGAPQLDDCPICGARLELVSTPADGFALAFPQHLPLRRPPPEPFRLSPQAEEPS